uniref:acylphosphatase n=1 Tax=Vibrio cholerae TaxID=666 RepID=UPI0038B45D9B
MEKQCSKFIVSGHVQGVGFRYHTSHQGLKLGLTGCSGQLKLATVLEFSQYNRSDSLG